MVAPEKHSVMISGHRTSVSLEPEFWATLRDLAENQGKSISALLAEIDEVRGERNLSSAARVYVLNALKRN